MSGENLINAAENGNADELTRLLEFGVDVNYRDDVRYRLLSNYNSKKRDEFTQLANNTNSVAVPPWRKVAQLLKRYLVN